MLMERELTINNSVCGRWFLCLIALFLMSVGMQAENYGITVAGVEVTDANAGNVLGDNITAGTVSFNPQTNTLTLNNVSMNGNVVSSIDNLNVKLVGVSTFNIDNSDGNRHYLFQSTITTATLTFSADELGATLQGYGTTINYKLDLTYWFDVAYDNIDYWSATTTQMDDKDYCQVSKPYVIVDGSAINDANKNNPDRSGVSFDLTNNKVTLSGFQRENQSYNSYSLITSNIANLNVDIQGGLNYIYLNTKKTNEEITSRGFVYTGASGQESSLNVTVAESSKLLLSWSGQTATTNWLQEGFSQTNMALDKTKMQEAGVLAEAGVPYDYQMTISNYTPPVSYGITVAGVEVNSENASNITGVNITAGTVSFNPQTNTLTLNNASISAYDAPIVSGLDNLTVFLIGESSIFGGSPTFSKTSDVENVTVTFTTDEESNGSLFINNVQKNLYGEGLTPVYSNVFIKHEGDGHTIDCLLDVRVGIVEVTSFNKDNVLGDGKVSYNAETHTLTLNNATISNDGSDPEPMETPGVYYSGTDDFTINLIGTNTINSENCSAIRGGQTPKLIFTKAGEQPASLQMETTESSVIDGFSVVNHEGLFKIDERILGVDNTPDTYTVLVSSTLLSGGSGTPGDPLLIKTKEDLTNFAYYICNNKISRSVSVKLYNDLDCAGLTHFAPIGYNNLAFEGTFYGNDKTISNLSIENAGLGTVGLFSYLPEGASVERLTLDNCTISGGNSSNNNIGGLVGTLSGGTISNCIIKNSSISCKNDTQSPTVGGLVGELSSGSITNSTVQACTVNAVTQDTWNSGAVAQAGGIVGNAAGGTITGCQVKGATTVMADYGEYMATVSAGAIVARNGSATLSNNTYEYTVNASTNKYNGTSTELTTKSGYTQRGVGGHTYNEQTEQYEDNPDLFENNGAVMYTKKVTLPAESTKATVMGEEGTYYATVEIGEGLGILVAPNQTATLKAIPENGYVVASFTATNTTTSEAITTTATEMESNEMQYTFAMPDAHVSVAVTTATAYGISIAGVTVTELNAANILGDGTVSYNASKHTLTLNGATIGNDGSGSDPMEACGIDYSETADLTISLKGTNMIYGMGGCNAIRYNGQGDVAPKLIFTKGDDQECSLQLNTSSNYERTAISGGFSEIQGVWGVGTTDNGLAIIADKEVKYDSEAGLTIEKVVNYTVNYVPLSSTLITSYYGLAISGVPVYEGNKSNITGEGIYGNGTASFDLTTNTLTLNNVNLNPDYAQNDGDLRVSIVTSLAQLNINLIGESQTYAIKTTNESGTLTFKSAEANRGAARLNFWYNAEPYYIGFGENKVTYNDGLCLRNSSSNSSFPKVVALYVPKVVTEEKERGLYYPDHEFTFSMEEEVEGFDIYYANMLGGDPVKTTNGKFTLAEGRYTLRVYPIYPGMDTDPSKNSQFASERYAKVIAKPTFSKENGTYNESFTLTLQNVPEQDAREEWAEGLSENIMVPQVWYFINDNKNDSIRYDATKGISVTESCKVSVYVIDVDSAKKLKSTPVEAHYVIRQDAGLAYTQNNESVEVAEYTIGGANNPALPTLQNENELAVTYTSSDNNVATLNEEGIVTPVGVGRTTISATSEQTDVLLAGEASYLLTVYKDL